MHFQHCDERTIQITPKHAPKAPAKEGLQAPEKKRRRLNFDDKEEQEEKEIKISDLNKVIGKSGNWFLTCKVQKKEEIRPYENQRGRGVYFSMVLTDSSDSARCVAFNGTARKFEKQFEVFLTK